MLKRQCFNFVNTLEFPFPLFVSYNRMTEKLEEKELITTIEIWFAVCQE